MTTEPKAGDRAEMAHLMQILEQATNRLGKSFETIAKLQEEVAERDRQLAKKTRLEMLGRMAASLAHEIRNPLGGIALYAKMLKQDLTAEPEKVERLDKILGAVTHLNRLVEDMLTYGRDLEPHLQEASLNEVIDSALLLGSETLAGRHVTVTRDAGLDRRLPLDAAMIQRVFLNLLLNAAQALEEGGTVEIVVAPEEGGVSVRFQDNGPGLADPERIFTPFYTTKAKGTGLGLAIARKIVEAHGGTITAANGPAGGAVFQVWLPRPESSS